MIVFDMKCAHGHGFEAWFGSASDYETQLARRLITCPACDDHNVEKAVMAPAVSAKGNRSLGPERLRELRADVEQHCDYVGDRFADEARHRHAAGATSRGIYGETSLSTALELLEEGIAVQPLPFRPRQTSDA